MAFDFPASPTDGQVFAPAGGPTYVFSGGVWSQQLPAMQGAIISDGPPTGAPEGSYWWESDTGNLYIFYDGFWVQIAGPTGGATAGPQNLIVNPAIQISQENGFNSGLSANNTYAADQWMGSWVGPTGGTHLQHLAINIGFPAPFGYLYFVGTATAYASPAVGDYFGMFQYLEGHTIQPALNWGRAEAVPAVLSFEVNSSVAGTFCAAIRSGNADRSISFPIVIAAGEINTWKRFSFVVPAITSGTFARDNTKAADVVFTAMAGTNWQAPSAGVWSNANYIGIVGQTNLLATGSKTLYVRKIGLYADPAGTGIAPPFEMPDYATELVKCQRYYWKHPAPTHWYLGTYISTLSVRVLQSGRWPVTMRTAPTVSATVNLGTIGSAVGSVDTAFVNTTGVADASGCYLTSLIGTARM